MPSLKTEYGRNWLIDRALQGDTANELTDIAVGDGTTDPSELDTSLDNEIYRVSFTNTNANIYAVDELVGTYRVDITVSGGVEVPADSSISEFGIFDSGGNLVYREVRPSTTVSSGERISFEIEIELTNI